MSAGIFFRFVRGLVSRTLAWTAIYAALSVAIPATAMRVDLGRIVRINQDQGFYRVVGATSLDWQTVQLTLENMQTGERFPFKVNNAADLDHAEGLIPYVGGSNRALPPLF